MLNMNSKFKKFISSKSLKVITGVLVAGCLTAGSYLVGFEQAAGLPATYKFYPTYKTLAKVGKKTIKMDQLQKQMDMHFALQPQKEFTAEEINEQEQTYIDYLVTKEALKQKAEKEGLTIEEDIINSQYEDLTQSLESSYSMTMDEIFKKYSITESMIKESIKDELLGNAYLDKIAESSDEEIEEYYKNNPDEFNTCEASHILLLTVDPQNSYQELSEEEKVNAKQKAEEVLEKVLKGEDFAKLAKTYSEDASASEGGNLGSFKKGEMVSEFEKAAFALKVGDVTTELVETNFGYHIIKKTGEGVLKFEEAKDSIKDTLTQQKKYNKIKEILSSSDVNIVYEAGSSKSNIINNIINIFK